MFTRNVQEGSGHEQNYRNYGKNIWRKFKKIYSASDSRERNLKINSPSNLECLHWENCIRRLIQALNKNDPEGRAQICIKLPKHIIYMYSLYIFTYYNIFMIIYPK